MPDNANIGKTETVAVADLVLYHKNPRRGNVDAIVDSIRHNGVYKPLVVNRGTHTGRPMEVLAGNHTTLALLALADESPGDPRWNTVDAYILDVDDDAAARIVIADNRTSDLAATDDRTLYDLLATLDSTDGTGYVEDDVDDLRAMLEEMEEEDLPEFGGVVGDRRASSSGDDDEDEDSPSGLLSNSADADNAAKYADRATRMFVLAFPIKQYAWVAEALERVADDRDLDTNSDVLLHLLSEYTGDEPPEVPVEDSDVDEDDPDRDWDEEGEA